MSLEKDCKGETTDGSSISYRFGRWGSDMDDSSSNLRELKNLVQTLEKMGEKELEGVEMFLFTDNSTAEAAFYKGSSSSEWLFDLVVRLSVLEMTRNCKIHIIHVAGTRMIAQGADGLSRGALTEGVMKGEAMKSFVPLHQSALERDPALEPWLRDWFESAGKNKGQDLEFLSMEDWFERGHDILEGSVNVDGQWVPNYVSGKFVWSPPPSLALPCLEELRRARHKRQESTHIFICPRLMTPAWKRHLHKAADIILELPPGHAAWSLTMATQRITSTFGIGKEGATGVQRRRKHQETCSAGTLESPEKAANGLLSNVAFTDQRGRVFHMDKSPMHTKWFQLFSKNCESRMGNSTSQDAALSVEAMLAMLEVLELRVQRTSTSREERRMAVMTAAVLVIGFCAALRGGEIMLVEATEFCRRIDAGRVESTQHVLVPLMGRFKNEIGERNFLLVLVAVTSSGIQIRKWLDRLAMILRLEGRDVGDPSPAICDENGYVLSTKVLERELHGLLKILQEKGVVPQGLSVESEFHIYRSLRRGATARATNMQLSKVVIDTNNRWRSMQTSRGKKNLPMSQLYLDIRVALPARLAFSAAM